ncbi:hypothetical protein NKH23_28005 [Mesorhizobium sp. M1328]|uniref:hypothetical protein n=1 Tax=Mesorhizobium sp. M1328 TaxID=2957082 RepID=UPI0033361E07
MTADEKALASVRRPDFDPNDRFVAVEAVTAYLAAFHDQHPDGRPIIDHQATHRWQGLVSEIGMCVYRTTVFEIMHRTTDRKALTDREVLFLVMTADCPDTYTAADWDAMVAQRLEAANSRRDAAKRKERNSHDDERAERGGRVQHRLDHIAGTYAVPDAALSHRAKLRRSKSIKAAAERREGRRKVVEGVVVQHRNADWRDMTSDQVKEHQTVLDKLAAKGTLDAVFAEELSGKIPPDLYYLQRFGRVKRL